ncbi:Bug family tripartite tricarboxylate transporter substrate binding protein [Achromobacter aloeverae]
MDRRSFIALSAATAACTAWPGLARAQRDDAFPSRSLRIIVPLAPGGGTDAVSRLVAIEMGHVLGQAVVVENQSGGSGTIGMMTVVRAAPDGYTLLTGTPSLSIDPSLRHDMKFDPLKDLQPVSLFSKVPYVLVSSSHLGALTVAQLLAKAKAAPGALTFGSPGVGSGGHLAGELFQLMAGVKLTHIPYKGSGPAMNDLRGGRIDLLFGTTPAVVQFIHAGALHAIGVSSPTRTRILPEVPAISESGVPGYSTYSWYGAWAPARVPRDVIDKLNAAVRAALDSPKVRQAIEADGGEPAATTPEAAGRFLQAEIAKWREVIAKAGIKAE